MRTVLLVSLVVLALAVPAYSAIVLEDGVVYSNTTEQHSWVFEQDAGYWAVVGVRPFYANDWDMDLYDNIDFTPPILASSEFAGTEIDFVAVDFNHAVYGWHGIWLDHYSGTGGCHIEYENGAQSLNAPGTNGTYTWVPKHVVRIWDVFLEPDVEYTFTLDISYGSLDMGMALLKSDPASVSSYYKSRDEAVRSADEFGGGSAESFTFEMGSSADYLGLVVWSNDGSGSADYSISITCETPGAPVPLVPHNDDTVCVIPSVSIDWTDVGGATRYHLQVDDNSDFSSPVKDVYPSESHYYASGLDPWKTYYWRVAGCNDECGCGNWCSTRNFYAAGVPGAPVPLVPHNDTVCVNPSVPIDWTDVGGATGYHLQVDDNSDFSSPVKDVYPSESHYYASGLDPWKTYYWRVAGCNDECGCGNWCSTRNFYAADVPSTPGTPSASPNPVCVDTQYCLTWGSVSGATSYEISENNGSWVNIGNTTSKCYTKSASGTYCYRVRAKNLCDTGAASGSCPVTVNPLPGTPSSANCTPGCGYIDVIWSSVPAAHRYCIYRDGYKLACVTSTAYRDNSPGDSQRCYRISSQNECGEGEQSWPPSCCTAKDPPPPPSSVNCTSGCGYIDVSWSSVSGATWSLIYRDAKKVDSVAASTTSWRDDNPSSSQRCYTVSSKNQCGEGSQSSPPRCCTPEYPPPAPDTLYCSGCTDDTAQVDEPYEIWWYSIDGATFYRLYEDGSRVDDADSTDTLAEIVHDDANDYHYALAACNHCGCSDTSNSLRIPTGVEEIDSPETPNNFALSQNYPNPFNPETRIEFSLPRASFVTVDVFSILGKRIRRLVYERLSAGYKVVTWDGRDDNGQSVSSGIYFYRIVADDFAESKKMILLR